MCFIRIENAHDFMKSAVCSKIKCKSDSVDNLSLPRVKKKKKRVDINNSGTCTL